MNKVQCFYLIAVAMFILISCTEKHSTLVPKRPNVIIILTDDQGWGDLSMNGNTNLSTPNIDNIAKSGASFQNFYVNAVYSPTRAEFLTGRYSFKRNLQHWWWGERMDVDETTVTKFLKKQDIKQRPMENGTTECSILIIQTLVVLTIFMVSVLDIGVGISLRC